MATRKVKELARHFIGLNVTGGNFGNIKAIYKVLMSDGSSRIEYGKIISVYDTTRVGGSKVSAACLRAFILLYDHISGACEALDREQDHE